MRLTREQWFELSQAVITLASKSVSTQPQTEHGAIGIHPFFGPCPMPRRSRMHDDDGFYGLLFALGKNGETAMREGIDPGDGPCTPRSTRKELLELLARCYREMNTMTGELKNRNLEAVITRLYNCHAMLSTICRTLQVEELRPDGQVEIPYFTDLKEELLSTKKQKRC